MAPMVLKAVTLYFRISSQKRLAENFLASATCAPRCSPRVTQSQSALPWKRGRQVYRMSDFLYNVYEGIDRNFTELLPYRYMTPLGSPVVPEVYSMKHISSLL